MRKFMEIMEKCFIPVAAKLGAQKHLVAIRDGFAVIMPLVITASFMVLFNNLPIPGYSEFMTEIFGKGWSVFGVKIVDATLGMMSIIVVYSIAYHLAIQYDKDGMACGFACLTSSFIFYSSVEYASNGFALPFTYTGATGVFIAMVIAVVLGSLYCLFADAKFLVIKMPDGVPPAIAKAFAALIPTLLVLMLASAVHLCIKWGLNIDNIHAYVAKLILEPMQSIFSESLGMLLLFIFLTQALWFFGLHGSNIMYPIVQATLFPLTLENVDALKKGIDIPNVINSQFLDSFVNMGGSGATICLVIAILLVSKNKASRGIAGLGLAPGLFNINEPILFGMPIVLNPIYIVPFIAVPILFATTSYYATINGIIDRISVAPGWTTPPVLGAFLSTGDWRAGVLALINLIVGILIYLPFVLVADRKAELDEMNMSL